MYIDFEGIAGSGKTALAERVAARLSRMGHRVMHARVSPHGASVSSRIGQLERETQPLGLTPGAAALLARARELQQREDVVLPALRRGEVCLTEGALLSSWSEGSAPAGDRASFSDPALQPDLVVLLDVDPDLGRWRKHAQAEGAAGPSSRGVAARARSFLLSRAAQDPARWLVIENEGRPLHVIEERITEAILARLERRVAQVERLLPTSQPAAGARTAEQLEEAFFAMLDGLQDREPALCALLLEGIGGLAATRRRLQLLERLPKEVARSLVGVTDAESQRLREVLIPLAPSEVALGLAGVVDPWADRMRERLMEPAAGEVVSTLTGDDRAQAWAWREHALEQGFEAEVLRGIAGLDSARAWRLRSAGLSRGWLAPVAESLTGLQGMDAEALRDRLFQDVPLAVLASTRGLCSAHAARLRELFFERAPGAVLRTLEGVESSAAQSLRERAAPDCPEALESLFELTSDAAWSLRDRFLSAWPVAAVGSLGKLARTERGLAMLERALALGGERLGVLRSAYAAWMRGSPGRPIAPPALSLEPSAEQPC